jgi:hypothetical protein
MFASRGDYVCKLLQIASAKEFRCINAVIRVETEVAGLDGALQRAAGNAAAARGIRDGELGHGWA